MRAESKIFASSARAPRPRACPCPRGRGGWTQGGSAAAEEARAALTAVVVVVAPRLIPPNLTCAKRPPQSLHPLILHTLHLAKMLNLEQKCCKMQKYLAKKYLHRPLTVVGGSTAGGKLTFLGLELLL